MKTRIIAGIKRGTKLDNPEKGTRPITNRIKQSVFDLISDFIPRANVLDLYAGGGNFGIEAISRGAENATFVDIAKESMEFIQNNLKKTNFSSQAKVVQSNVADYVRKKTTETYDIIMCDPPFDNVNITHIIDASKLLSQSGVLIFRHPKDVITPKTLGRTRLRHTQKYGKSIVSFYTL